MEKAKDIKKTAVKKPAAESKAKPVVDSKVAVIGIIVEKLEAVDKLHAILRKHENAIIGRMGLPYRSKNLRIISIALDAPQGVITQLSRKIAALDGVRVETACSLV